MCSCVHLPAADNIMSCTAVLSLDWAADGQPEGGAGPVDPAQAGGGGDRQPPDGGPLLHLPPAPPHRLPGGGAAAGGGAAGGCFKQLSCVWQGG